MFLNSTLHWHVSLGEFIAYGPGGNPDFTNAPGHGDDDARFYDRQQVYIDDCGGWLPRHPSTAAPKTRIDYSLPLYRH